MRPVAEFTISQDEVACLIEDRFPELAPLRIELLGEGWDNSAWRINDEFVFRLPRRELGADCLAGELCVLPHLTGRLTRPIPEILFVGEPSSRFPWSYAGYRFLPGTPLDELGLRSDARHQLARALGEFLKVLHEIPVEDARLWGAPGDTLGRMNIERRIQDSHQLIAEAESRGVLTEGHRWGGILSRAEQLRSGECCESLVHGDLYAKHLLVDSSDWGAPELSAVIDWGDVHLGDPSGDLAAAFTLFAEPERRVFFAAYGPAGEDVCALARLRALNHTLHCLLGCGADEAFRVESRLALDHLLT